MVIKPFRAIKAYQGVVVQGPEWVLICGFGEGGEQWCQKNPAPPFPSPFSDGSTATPITPEQDGMERKNFLNLQRLFNSNQ